MAVMDAMMPWYLNLNLSLMSPTKPSFILMLRTVCDISFEEFQYGHRDGYFVYKNVNISANLFLHVGLMSYMISAQFN